MNYGLLTKLYSPAAAMVCQEQFFKKQGQVG
jgi:hypothetical protein